MYIDRHTQRLSQGLWTWWPSRFHRLREVSVTCVESKSALLHTSICDFCRDFEQHVVLDVSIGRTGILHCAIRMISCDLSRHCEVCRYCTATLWPGKREEEEGRWVLLTRDGVVVRRNLGEQSFMSLCWLSEGVKTVKFIEELKAGSPHSGLLCSADPDDNKNNKSWLQHT